MKAKGIFMFKSLEQRKAGNFTNKETGEVIEYDACYVLVADEFGADGKITERKFKIDKNDKTLSGDLSALEAYTKIELEFNVVLYTSNAKLVPCRFELV